MQALEDAYCDIVKMALDKSTSFQSVLIIGEDVDLLVLLKGFGSAVKNVYFPKSAEVTLAPSIFLNPIQ